MATRHKLAYPLLTLLAGCSAAAPHPTHVVRSLLENRQDKVVMQQWDLSCGAAALATVLTYGLDDPVSERDIAAALLKQTSVRQVQRQLGFSLLDLKKFATGHGFDAQGYGDMTIADLQSMTPAIVPVRIRDLNHFVVFRGMWGNR